MRDAWPYLLAIDLTGPMLGEGLVDFKIDEEHQESRDEEGTRGGVDRITWKI